MRPLLVLGSVLVLSLAIASPASAQLRLPGKAAPAAESTTEDTGSTDQADVLVGQVVGGFDDVARTFEQAARASMRSNERLFEALGFTEQANAMKKRMQNLAAIEDPAERQAAITETISDPQIIADLAEAAKNTVELSEDRRESIQDAHLLNLRAALTFTNLAVDTVNLTSAMAQLGLGMTNPATIAAMDRAGKTPEWFNQTLKPSLKGIDQGAKAFDKSAKKNGALMKDLFKRFDIKPPSPADITPIDDSSDF